MYVGCVPLRCVRWVWVVDGWNSSRELKQSWRFVEAFGGGRLGQEDGGVVAARRGDRYGLDIYEFKAVRDR